MTRESDARRPMDVVVRGAVQRAALARASQALCVGLGAFGLVLGLAVIEGAAIEDVDALFVAFVAALSVGLAWSIGHPVGETRTVRRADAMLGFDGGLIAAFEHERRSPGSAFARLGARRVLARVPARELREAAAPPTVPFVAAPFIAAGVLALALDRVQAADEGPEEWMLLRSAGNLVDHAAQRAAREGAADPDLLSRMMAASDDAESLASQGRGEAGGGPEMQAHLDQLAEEIEALAEELGADAPEIAGLLGDAAAAVDAYDLAQELASAARPSAEAGAASAGTDAHDDGGASARDGRGAVDSGAGVSTASGGPGAESTPQDAAAEAGGSEPAEPSGPRSVTAGAGGGTIGGSGARAEVPEAGPDGPGPARSVVGPRPTWSRDLDPLVERWQALQRDVR